MASLQGSMLLEVHRETVSAYPRPGGMSQASQHHEQIRNLSAMLQAELRTSCWWVSKTQPGAVYLD